MNSSTNNKFGDRYITPRDFCNYAIALNLVAPNLTERLLEYLERVNLLNPITRVRFPAEVARYFEAAHTYYGWAVLLPVEKDEDRLRAADKLRQDLFWGIWQLPANFGEREHLLDALELEHQEFIQKDFSPATFTDWETHRTPVWMDEEGNIINDGGRYSPTYYHYWQIFALAAILRSGAIILYPAGNQSVVEAIFKVNLSDPNVRSEIYPHINIEAHKELNEINQYKAEFEAVAYFEAYRDNALRVYYDKFNKKTGLLPLKEARVYHRRERDVARDAINKFNVKSEDILKFIGKQAEWWNTAKERGPEAVAKEYAHNIRVTIELYQLLTGKDINEITSSVGRRGGWFKPILKVIFPDWIEEQRDLTKRALMNWSGKSLGGVPSPFPYTESEIEAFCDWLEQEGFYQYYWHMSRFNDFGRVEAPIYKAAAAAEAVAFANLLEMIANKVLEARGSKPRSKTLAEKLHIIFNNKGVVHLEQPLVQFKGLTNTNKSSLKRRLAQIERIKHIKLGDQYAPLVRTLLKLVAIRNEGSHLGLNNFDRVEILDMLETMAVASLILWKAR